MLLVPHPYVLCLPGGLPMPLCLRTFSDLGGWGCSVPFRAGQKCQLMSQEQSSIIEKWELVYQYPNSSLRGTVLRHVPADSQRVLSRIKHQLPTTETCYLTSALLALHSPLLPYPLPQVVLNKLLAPKSLPQNLLLHSRGSS